MTMKLSVILVSIVSVSALTKLRNSQRYYRYGSTTNGSPTAVLKRIATLPVIESARFVLPQGLYQPDLSDKDLKINPSTSTTSPIAFIIPAFVSSIVVAALVGHSLVTSSSHATDRIDTSIQPPSEISSRIDLWRETPLRLLGYTNEVGESFGPLYPNYIKPSYGVAFLYVGCDTVDKALLSINNGDNVVNVIRHGSDALVWQTLASVLIPGKVINIVTNTAARLTNSTLALQRLPPKVTKWLPTAIGLVTIPFIVHPIDTFVDLLLDNTLRLL